MHLTFEEMRTLNIELRPDGSGCFVVLKDYAKAGIIQKGRFGWRARSERGDQSTFRTMDAAVRFVCYC